MPEQIIIIGAGGHAKVIADIIHRSGDSVAGYLDDKDPAKLPEYHILGKVADAEAYAQKGYAFLCAIGDNATRQSVTARYALRWHTAVHPSAVIAEDVVIGEGTVVMAGAIVNSGSRIGRHAIVNTAASVDHDNLLGDYVHLSPGVHLAGRVSVGEGTWIGVGACVINDLYICDGCVIGAGAAVVRDIDERGVYVGVPAKKLSEGK